jgi:hypothetical protein
LSHCIRLSANITLPYRRHKHYIKLAASLLESSFQLIVDVGPDLSRVLPPLLLNDPRSCTPLSFLHISSLILLSLQSAALIVQFQALQLDLALLEAAEHALDTYGGFDSFFFQEVFHIGLKSLEFKFELFTSIRRTNRFLTNFIIETSFLT